MKLPTIRRATIKIEPTTILRPTIGGNLMKRENGNVIFSEFEFEELSRIEYESYNRGFAAAQPDKKQSEAIKQILKGLTLLADD